MVNQSKRIDWERVVLVPILSFLLLASSFGLFGHFGDDLGSFTGMIALRLVHSLLLVAFYLLAIVLLLVRTDAKAKSAHLLPRVAAYVGTFTPMLLGFVPSSSVRPWLALPAVFLQAAGLAFAIYALAVLRRSFGVEPQVRSLVTSGPYHFIRHPLYVGELISLTGAVLVGPTWQKAAILVVTAVIAAYRAIQEERLLAAHIPEYEAYIGSTKRFVPGLV